MSLEQCYKRFGNCFANHLSSVRARETKKVAKLLIKRQCVIGLRNWLKDHRDGRQ